MNVLSHNTNINNNYEFCLHAAGGNYACPANDGNFACLKKKGFFDLQYRNF
ncbi:MAG: hypothetical protein IIA48_10550 [Bacteroidetes bacterium]|nr:hypothetical protein [Bacteroidota bacterium]